MRDEERFLAGIESPYQVVSITVETMLLVLEISPSRGEVSVLEFDLEVSGMEYPECVVLIGVRWYT